MRPHADHRASGAGGSQDEELLGDHGRARRSLLTPAAKKGPRELGALGLDGGLIRHVNRWLAPFRDRYFRAELTGLERLPAGPTMIVGNHDGGYIAADALCFGSFYYERLGYHRGLYTMMHDFPFRIAPGMTSWLNRLGFLPASRKNAGRVLDEGGDLLVFPGGDWEAFRPYWQRSRLELGHRTGFIKEALRCRVPITPMVSVGGHETLFVLARGGQLARKLGIKRALRSDVLPLWMGLPWGIGFGPIPNLPLPSKIKVELLEPIRLWEELGSPRDLEDPRLLQAGLERVRRPMQAALARLYAERRYPIIG